jgi:hypothetical protein
VDVFVAVVCLLNIFSIIRSIFELFCLFVKQTTARNTSTLRSIREPEAVASVQKCS